MADITSDCTIYSSVAGDFKHLILVTPATAATGDTIDLDSDVADAKGRKMGVILNTLLQDDTGADKLASWDPATGIITLGTIVTGIHNLSVWGKN